VGRAGCRGREQTASGTFSYAQRMITRRTAARAAVVSADAASPRSPAAVDSWAGVGSSSLVENALRRSTRVLEPPTARAGRGARQRRRAREKGSAQEEEVVHSGLVRTREQELNRRSVPLCCLAVHAARCKPSLCQDSLKVRFRLSASALGLASWVSSPYPLRPRLQVDRVPHLTLYLSGPVGRVPSLVGLSHFRSRWSRDLRGSYEIHVRTKDPAHPVQ